MRCRYVLATLCAAAATLALPAIAGASASQSGHKSGGPASRAALPALPARGAAGAAWLRAQPRFIPAPEAIAAAAAIEGTIHDTSGSAMASAGVDWWVGDATGSGTTDGSGHYSFPSVPAASGNGEIVALSSDGNTWYDWWNLSWTAPGPTSFDMLPGGVNLSGATGGPWGQWATNLETDVFTSVGTQLKDAWRSFPGTTSAVAPALPGTVEGVAAYFYRDEGAEVQDFNGQVVTEGVTPPQSATVEEATAQRVWTGGSSWTKPWGSGKPGARLKVWLQNYPTTWVNQIVGFSENPSNSAFKSFGGYRSLGTTAHSRALTVPARAVPGYGYRLWLMHDAGPLQLTTWFQICTLNASKTTISKGTAVRFSGVVPVQDHMGSTAGKRTTVYMFVHKGTAGQPTKLDPRSQGWQYVGAFRTDGYGKYRTPLLKPRVTLTAVMYYPGDDWYYAAYTSPRKITVR